VARKYRLSAKADIGLAKIWREVAFDNVRAADDLYARILGKIKNASEHPGIGSLRPDIARDARMLIEGNYNIYYIQKGHSIVVTAIVHAKRHPANW
jgi:toxin ParE1/3/4